MGWDGSGEVTMTTDSAMVMCKAAKLLNWEWIPCACHILHISTLYGLKALGASMKVGTHESLRGAMANEYINWDEHDQETVGGVLDITASRARIFDFIINGINQKRANEFIAKFAVRYEKAVISLELIFFFSYPANSWFHLSQTRNTPLRAAVRSFELTTLSSAMDE